MKNYEYAPKDAILASNTSSLSITYIASVVSNPEGFIGMHFFNPVHRMPLIEVVKTPMTSTQTIVTSLAFARRLGKTPILVKDQCGFIVNRVLLPMINEAVYTLYEGVGSVEAIDTAVREQLDRVAHSTLLGLAGVPLPQDRIVLRDPDNAETVPPGIGWPQDAQCNMPRRA